MSNETKIKCPSCHTEIDVNNVLSSQVRAELQSEFSAGFEKERAELKRKEAEFEQKRANQNVIFREQVDKQLKEERSVLELSLKTKYEKEKSEEFYSLQKELKEKSEQVIELNASRAEIERLKRANAEIKSVADAEAEKRITETVNIEKEKIQKHEQDKNELIVKELNKKLEDQKRLTEEMKRKQEQGSMQLQGEAQELAIEGWLADNFPLDTVVPVGKGVRGGDCRQIVNTRSKENCGTIYYESKRTKDFGRDWIEKFKNDIREQNATVGVLVTTAMPPGMDRLGLRDGIWICSYEEFKGLCFVLRENIIALDLAVASQENKGDKMVMLYDYLTSNEFKLQVEGIMEGYKQMQDDLISEQRVITGTWKKREKQLQKVLNNTTYMYSSLRGIAGGAIQAIKSLELPEPDAEDTDFEEA